MAKDWPSKQPKPQSRPSTAFDKNEAGTPVTGFDSVATPAQPSKGPGKGVPASKKVIR